MTLEDLPHVEGPRVLRAMPLTEAAPGLRDRPGEHRFPPGPEHDREDFAVP